MSEGAGSKSAPGGKSTSSVPPRAGKAGRPSPGSRPAQKVKASQARQARKRRNRMVAAISAGVVVVVIGVLVAVYAAGGGTASGAPRQPAPASAVSNITSVPIATLVAASHQVSNLSGASAISQPPLTSGGKPEVLYIGAEFCPICAAERWAMVVALSQFGTFTNLQQTHSAVRDGNIPTLSFYGSTYASQYLTFTPVETTTNQPQGSYYKTLQTPTAAQQAIWTAQQGSRQTFPFVYIGGKWVLETAQYPPQALEGHSFSQIASSVGSNDNTIGADIDASAAVMVKYLCSITGQQPANTCQAVSGVTLPAAPQSGSSSPAG